MHDGTTGEPLATIPNPEPGEADLFGDVMPLGRRFVVSSWADDPDGLVDTGSVYLYDSTSGALIWTLHDPEGTAGDEFGMTTARLGNNLLVAAPATKVDGVARAGVVYYIDGDDGTLLQTIRSPEPETENLFGHLSIGAVGEAGNVVIGAINHDTGGRASSGTIYLYRSR